MSLGLRLHQDRCVSVLFLAPHPAGHGGDQGGALPAAVLRLVEGDLALRGQVLQRLLHDSGEAGGRVEGL